jgi:hypothetical protein
MAIAVYIAVALALLFFTGLADFMPTPPCYPGCSSTDALFDALFWSAVGILLAQILAGIAWVGHRNWRAFSILIGVPVYVITAGLLVPTIGAWMMGRHAASSTTTLWHPKGSALSWSALVILLCLVAAGGVWATVGKRKLLSTSSIKKRTS